MKTLLLALFCLAAVAGQAQRSLEKLWESDTTLAVPESVLYYQDGLYVSLIDGQPWEVDGKGGIAKLDKNGKILNATWVTGLSAPKGMGLWEKKLFVADISAVVVINTANGKVESKIAVEGATGLNDITIDEKGVVYVSDSRQGKVHQIKNGKAELYLSDLKGVNGLKAVGSDLYILTTNDVIKASADKTLVTVATTALGGDGIEPVGNGDFVISCWAGLIYYLDKDGTLLTLLDTREQKINTADIGYNPAQRIVYVPTFFKKSVVAYTLK
ncbi:MAG: ATP/GTP-binding protein [Cyclobacteriaceae bacterium]|nr:ATP/GTP-binding protein [Cyclobacteriaceae bacterium]